MKEKRLVIFLCFIFVIAILGFGAIIKKEIDSVQLIVNGNYDTKIEFKQAKFLGKFQDTDRGTKYNRRYSVSKYDRFELIDTGEILELKYSSEGHSGEPDVIIAIRSLYTKDGKFIKNEYGVYPSSDSFIGRISSSSNNKEFYIYDRKNNVQMVTNILEDFNFLSGRYQKDLLNVKFYHNKESKKENGIGEFLSSEEKIYNVGDISYDKIHVYETDYGTMYILKEERIVDNEVVNREYLGILKYGNLVNQELIFKTSYSYLGSEDIISDFKQIVKEKEL